MNYCEYVKFDRQLREQLARDNRKSYLFCETVLFAACMALMLTIMDATPRSLWKARPFERLVFILAWSLVMAWVELRRLRNGVQHRRCPHLKNI